MRGSKPYSGYSNTPPIQDDFPLAQVGRSTPGGEYLRRFWHPFLLTSELRDLPVKVRLLGEDLVAFRDGGGRFGLLHRACIHRGASLEYGIIADRGIRCCYHGWHFDIDGTVISTPAEPPTSRIRENFCQGAYPVREMHGLLFAYMGPPEVMPELPVFDVFTNPTGTRLAPFQLHLPCNWIQIVENACDPIHNVYLHTVVAGQQFSPAFAVQPAIDFIDTPIGFLSMATRCVDKNVFVRAADIMMPNVANFTGAANTASDENVAIHTSMTRWAVPIDDNESFYMGYMHLNRYTDPEGRLDPRDYGVGRMNFIGQTNDRPYRERQREPGDWDAVSSQGRVANRKAEHLGTTDRGIVKFRRRLASAIAELEAGREPAHLGAGAGSTISTFCHETVLQLPDGAALSGQESLTEFGRRATAVVIESGPLPYEERQAASLGQLRTLVNGLAHGSTRVKGAAE